MSTCLICGAPWRDDFQCFGCGGWMHFDCYWPRFASGRERDKIARAQDITQRSNILAVVTSPTGGEFEVKLAPPMAGALVESIKIVCPACRAD